MGPIRETPTQYAILNEDPERISNPLVSPQSSSLGKRVGYAALNSFAIISGLTLMTISIPMQKPYDGPEDPQSRTTALGIVLMLVGEVCAATPLAYLFKRCFYPDTPQNNRH